MRGWIIPFSLIDAESSVISLSLNIFLGCSLFAFTFVIGIKRDPVLFSVLSVFTIGAVFAPRSALIPLPNAGLFLLAVLFLFIISPLIKADNHQN